MWPQIKSSLLDLDTGRTNQCKQACLFVGLVAVVGARSVKVHNTEGRIIQKRELTNSLANTFPLRDDSDMTQEEAMIWEG
jgi:hypothetical protein